MASPTAASPIPSVGILILNYRQPSTTLACIRRLREVEGDRSCILWLENDAAITRTIAEATLSGSGLPWVLLDPAVDELPPPGHIGFIPISDNLGYGGGNNVGLRFLHHHGVAYAWVMNNDTFLLEGSSADLLAAALERPEVGLWGATLITPEGRTYSGGTLRERDFATLPIHGVEAMEGDAMAYVSGCSLFFSLALAARVGFIPEDYFLYYEDPAFSLEIRRLGFDLSALERIVVRHEESHATGPRSPLMEYYSRRNRWAFIQRYFPDQLEHQRRRAWYRFQSLAFRGAFRRIWIEWLAMRDWKAGKMYRTNRRLIHQV